MYHVPAAVRVYAGGVAHQGGWVVPAVREGAMTMPEWLQAILLVFGAISIALGVLVVFGAGG